MSIQFVSALVAKAGKSETLKNFIETQVMPVVKVSSGCESCQLLQDIEDAHKFLIMEVWASVADHKAAIKNIPAESIGQFMELVAAPPQANHYQILHSL